MPVMLPTCGIIHIFLVKVSMIWVRHGVVKEVPDERRVAAKEGFNLIAGGVDGHAESGADVAQADAAAQGVEVEGGGGEVELGRDVAAV